VRCPAALLLQRRTAEPMALASPRRRRPSGCGCEAARLPNRLVVNRNTGAHDLPGTRRVALRPHPTLRSDYARRRLRFAV
jgi:hypothetical protein